MQIRYTVKRTAPHGVGRDKLYDFNKRDPSDVWIAIKQPLLLLKWLTRFTITNLL